MHVGRLTQVKAHAALEPETGAMSDPTLCKYAALHLPRYTSYPTAAQFHDGIGETQYREWLAALSPADTLSLYLHVPFCHQLCWYCGCHTTVAKRPERIAHYAETLARELETVAALVPETAGTVSVHFGGGTPNTLAPETFEKLMATLRRLYSVQEGAEVSVELDPRSLAQPFVEAMAAAGVGRVSLGVQDVSPEVQEKINRIQPEEMVADAVARLRAAGIEGLNVDLMYGLPGQDEAHVEASVAAVTALRPSRVAVFGYAHVPWFAKHQRMIDAEALPELEARLDQAESARQALVAAGYVEIGFDHYALPEDSLASAWQAGRRRRNFQGYTADPASALIGFGASSIGTLPAGHVQNLPDLRHYREAIEAGGVATARGVAVDAEDRLRGRVIERLMCELPVDLEAMSEEAGLPATLFEESLGRLAPLEADGLVLREGWRVEPSQRGRPMVRAIAACFDRHLPSSGARHSRAA